MKIRAAISDPDTMRYLVVDAVQRSHTRPMQELHAEKEKDKARSRCFTGPNTVVGGLMNVGQNREKIK
jgi:hypothetical protein